MATQQLVYVTTNTSRLCPICGEESLDGDHFEDACNHVLRHGLKCLHIGQETRRDDNGKPWHSTVAVFESEVEFQPLDTAIVRPMPGRKV
jgi:transposase